MMEERYHLRGGRRGRGEGTREGGLVKERGVGGREGGRGGGGERERSSIGHLTNSDAVILTRTSISDRVKMKEATWRLPWSSRYRSSVVCSVKCLWL